MTLLKVQILIQNIKTDDVGKAKDFYSMLRLYLKCESGRRQKKTVTLYNRETLSKMCCCQGENTCKSMKKYKNVMFKNKMIDYSYYRGTQINSYEDL